MRILLAQINPTVGDLAGNAQKIKQAFALARKSSVDLVVCPELSLTGYPPEDFLQLPAFITAVENELRDLIDHSYGIIAIVGLPRRSHESSEKKLFNSAAILQNGTLRGYYDKMLLPTYDVFDERRYFEPGSTARCWDFYGKSVAITICEDIWQHSELISYTNYTCDPVKDLAPHQPDLLINLSASPYSISKLQNRLHVGKRVAQTLCCPVVLCNQVGGNDSLIFDGHSYHMDAFGELIDLCAGYREHLHILDVFKERPPIPIAELAFDPMGNLYEALVLGLRDYFHKGGFTKACLGISGGIDSALVATLAAQALGPENVLGLAMPSRYSSSSSLEDARQLAKNLKIAYREISIEKPFASYLDLLTPQFEEKSTPGTTEENIQARIRGMILMAFSNQLSYLVLSTGNKSEFALGYTTLYGDMCGGLGVIGDVLKSQVYTLSKWINRHEEIIPWNSLHKPPSAELKPNQKDSDTLPDYPTIDHVVVDYLENYHSAEEIAESHSYSLELVQDIVRRIQRAEYKRRQAPPSLRISEKSFTNGRRFPIIQKFV